MASLFEITESFKDRYTSKRYKKRFEIHQSVVTYESYVMMITGWRQFDIFLRCVPLYIVIDEQFIFRTECTKVWSCSTRYVITNGSPRRVLFYSSTKKIYSKRKSQNRLLPSVSQTIQVNSEHRLRNNCVMTRVNSEKFLLSLTNLGIHPGFVMDASEFLTNT